MSGSEDFVMGRLGAEIRVANEIATTVQFTAQQVNATESQCQCGGLRDVVFPVSRNAGTRGEFQKQAGRYSTMS